MGCVRPGSVRSSMKVGANKEGRKSISGAEHLLEDTTKSCARTCVTLSSTAESRTPILSRPYLPCSLAFTSSRSSTSSVLPPEPGEAMMLMPRLMVFSFVRKYARPKRDRHCTAKCNSWPSGVSTNLPFGGPPGVVISRFRDVNVYSSAGEGQKAHDAAIKAFLTLRLHQVIDAPLISLPLELVSHPLDFFRRTQIRLKERMFVSCARLRQTTALCFYRSFSKQLQHLVG